MNIDERKRLSEILIKFAPLAVAYASGKIMGAFGTTPVEVPMSMIEEAAEGMRDLKLMLYGKHEEARTL